jgi:hypothetical protein
VEGLEVEAEEAPEVEAEEEPGAGEEPGKCSEIPRRC